MMDRFLFATLTLLCAVPAFCGNNYEQTLEICEDALIQVSEIEVFCDTPYSWSYQRGSHRNSPTCDYGDYANITIDFDVVDYNNNETYMHMNVYSDEMELIYHSTSNNVINCDSCPDWYSKGSHSFTTKVQLYSVDGGSSSEFVPFVAIAFSSSARGGNNLGGANINCTEDFSFETEEEEPDEEDDEEDEDRADMVGDSALNSIASNNYYKYGLLVIGIVLTFVLTMIAFSCISKLCYRKQQEKEKSLMKNQYEESGGDPIKREDSTVVAPWIARNGWRQTNGDDYTPARTESPGNSEDEEEEKGQVPLENMDKIEKGRVGSFRVV